MNIKQKIINLKKYWWILALIIIFFFSYKIRAFNIQPDRLLSFDPIFQYRFTRYFAEWGHIPVWDELTYYTGRKTSAEVGPLMPYLTSIVYWLLKKFGFSLMTVCAYMSAIYGAMIVFPAFLLGRELSNKYGGLLAATLVGTAPQILIRTFGSSYDTDQIALFFIILTLYLGYYALRKKTVASFCLVLIGFSAFMLAWGMFTYTIYMLIAFCFIYFILSVSIRKGNILNLKEKVKSGLRDFKSDIIIIFSLIIGISIVGFLTDFDAMIPFLAIIGFATKAEAWIVNISIAELQPFNIFNLQGWIMAMGRFVTGQTIIDNFIFISFILLITFGLIRSYKKDMRVTSFLLTILILGVYTTSRGIRFTEFSSALFIILISVGFGYLVDFCSKKDMLLKSFSLGLGLLLAFFAIGLGSQIGYSLGPDINPNWENAWDFLRTKTPELSIVGTWWDPGHMIAGLGERRDYADGAHCGSECMYTINDRIIDLGKIMATNDEQESVNLIEKYQGTSPKAYWIASDDLIGKFQWLQYFGTGCDARKEARCPLYYQLPRGEIKYAPDGSPSLIYYGNVILVAANIPIPVFIQGRNAALMDEFIFYENGNVKSIKIDESTKTQIIEMLKPLETELNVKFVNQTIPLTAWIPQHYSYLVLIPQNLRNNVFTKMFMLEGQGLEHFKQVYRNEQVKIYEVKTN